MKELRLSTSPRIASAMLSPLDINVALTNGSADIGSSSHLDSSAVQPQFDRKLNNTKLIDGRDVILTCHVTGNPMPNVS